jgi:hypothetical protein
MCHLISYEVNLLTCNVLFVVGHPTIDLVMQEAIRVIHIIFKRMLN